MINDLWPREIEKLEQAGFDDYGGWLKEQIHLAHARYFVTDASAGA